MQEGEDRESIDAAKDGGNDLADDVMRDDDGDVAECRGGPGALQRREESDQPGGDALAVGEEVDRDDEHQKEPRDCFEREAAQAPTCFTSDSG